MIIIDTYSIDDQNLKNSLKRIGDLINLDGPLLSLFKDERNGDLYLFDWVDNDKKNNRWLIYKVFFSTISDYIDKKISYNEMLGTVREYFVTEIQRDQNPPFNILKIDKLPTEYSPDTILFFDETDAKNLPKIKSVLDDLKGKSKKAISHNQSFNTIIFQHGANYSLGRQRIKASGIVLPSHENILRPYPSLNLPHQNDRNYNKVLGKSELGSLCR